MSDSKSLLDKAGRYIESAELLADSGDYDSAVSRAYYAAFYLAETLLDALGHSFSSHRAVISAYGQEFARTGRLDPRFHRMLISAFEKRQQADYLPETNLTGDDVSSLISEVRKFREAAISWLRQQRDEV